MEPVGVRSTAVKPAAVKPAKSATVEATATAVKTPSAAVPSASAAPVRCVGEIRLAENRRAQQCSCNAQHTPPFAGPGSVIA
jgi:hypothetical protein